MLVFVKMFVKNVSFYPNEPPKGIDIMPDAYYCLLPIVHSTSNKNILKFNSAFYNYETSLYN